MFSLWRASSLEAAGTMLGQLSAPVCGQKKYGSYSVETLECRKRLNKFDLVLHIVQHEKALVGPPRPRAARAVTRVFFSLLVV
mmetsp:Transcript_23591/g.65649  ORF Transcript_23591/g.65649 Transcript_23591/m.65649 type:complete len:83 (-) Transcript_23591:4370-4618(-)